MPDPMPDMVSDKKTLYLIDGSGYIFRAFHALPPMNRPDGTPTNAVFGFTKMLMQLVEQVEAEYLAVIFDAGRNTFRNEIYPDYKANRAEPPEELVPQFSLIRDAVKAFNVPCLEMAGYEADDLIATYAAKAREQGFRTVIVSSDKDLMQLVNDDVAMLDPMKNRDIGHEQVIEKFGVGPDKVVDVQSLAGDSTDNVPGVPGIGIKTAAQLIADYGDLDTLLDRAEEIKQPKRRQNLIEFADQARISRDLVRLKRDVPVEDEIDSFETVDPDPATLRAFLEENAFRQIIVKLEELGAIGPGDGAAPASAPAASDAPDPEGQDYVLVQEEADLIAWIARARERGVVAFDTETTSLDAMRADLVGFSLSIEPGRACYVPIGHTAPGGEQASLLPGEEDREDVPLQIPFDTALDLIKPLLEDPAVLKIGQNIKYDYLVMLRQGIEIAPVDDTMLMSYVTAGGLHGHGMDELSKLHLDRTPISYKEVAGTGKSQITFDKVPLDKACDYAAEDADITLRLWQQLKPSLTENKVTTVYETLERPLIPVIARMEREGVKVDRQALGGLSKDFAKRMGDLERDIHELAGRGFNVGSPKQLGEILFDEMGLEGGKKGKTGAYATGAEILEQLAAQGHTLPERVLSWRQLSKLKSTYADALVDAINPETGRVHTSFAMAAASTGRLSSSDPNLQNIPIRTEEGRRIRETFVPEDGNVLLSVDYSQIELRLVAEIGGIRSLQDAFRDGIDIHALTASQVFGVPIEGMDPMTRRKAKAINFGIIYGISGFGLARQLGCSPGEAKGYIDAYFQQYPGIKDYMDRAKKEAKAQGFVVTLFGRRCHVPGINEKNPARRGFAERQAINAPIQGTAADIIKRAMIRLPDILAEKAPAARMLLQVHDELLFEVPQGEADAAAALITDVMEQAPRPAVRLGVPLVAEAGQGMTWAEAH
ncbi:MAG: DNA polymerase I [Alphaproteobacteria bacterium]|nr:DNA polymerase I [Alphaproteobacteria bacterium]